MRHLKGRQLCHAKYFMQGMTHFFESFELRTALVNSHALNRRSREFRHIIHHGGRVRGN